MVGKKDWSNKQQIINDKKILAEFLAEKFELVDSKNFGFKNHQNKKINRTFPHSRPIQIPIKIKKMGDSLIKEWSNIQKYEPSIQTLIEKSKP